MSQSYTKGIPISTDGTMALNSDLVVPSQAAVVAYVASVMPSGVTAVTATAPMTSSGGLTPNLAMPQASAVQSGYLSAADFATFSAGGVSVNDAIAYAIALG
jgi:hypothetical protein